MQDYYHSQIEHEGDEVAVLRAPGETDLHTAPRFAGDVDEVMSASSGPVVLDLTGSDFLESTALRVLVGVLLRAGGEGRSLVLVIPSRQVLRVFSVAGLRNYFRIVATRAEALATLADERELRRVA
jgi:anti-sigma B factor antagonist